MLILLLLAGPFAGLGQVKRTLLISGGEFEQPLIREVIALTHKTNPKICFLPTASGDNAVNIVHWYEACLDLPMRPRVQRVFIGSSPEQKGFEENLLDMDAIIVGGGNTLDLIGLWKIQGLDTILRKAYRQGIVLAGGSAGALCWFSGGVADSRPKNLSVIDCLGFLGSSMCAHYHSEPERIKIYRAAVLEGRLPAGYGCDDRAAILFENENYVRSLIAGHGDHVYFISVKAGKIDEQQLPDDEQVN
jgi:peptidase E